MHESLNALLKLQEIDSQIIFLRQAKERRPRDLDADRRRLAEKQRLLDGIAIEVKRLKMASDSREVDLKKNEAEIDKLRIALNQARSNQEYQILREQIARLQTQDGQIEEEVLKHLSDVDRLEQGRRGSEEELRGAQKEFDRRLDEMNQVLKGIDQELAQLQERRRGSANAIPTDHLQVYERVLARHSDSALARVENQVCQGCHMSVTPQTMNMLLLDRELIQCRNCLRILYLD